jgi:C-terminal processing protease CtpA/Prc
MIIDFSHEKLYVQPNKFFNESFSYDRSGIALIANGADLKQFLVQNVLENSPASEAGVKEGDEIISVNRLPARFFTLGAMNSKLQAKVGKTVRLTLKRNKERIKVSLKLRELI